MFSTSPRGWQLMPALVVILVTLSKPAVASESSVASVFQRIIGNHEKSEANSHKRFRTLSEMLAGSRLPSAVPRSRPGTPQVDAGPTQAWTSSQRSPASTPTVARPTRTSIAGARARR